jgi:lipopolysaccharide transport system ATP-binding protein
MNPALNISNISKQYRLGRVGASSLKDDFQQLWAKVKGVPNPFLKRGQPNDRSIRSEDAYVWALKDISLSINQGEIFGLIGKNGAGKSTLLKILSRITAPSTGNIKVYGRMASLLEVGTGFHPELTGKENIYLNGAILGMRRAEIRRKFDEIVDFSGVERYIDTPVKRYSSGMYVRLAFAVAAHLEPEILVVDEVLAVGDIEFQKKCLQKMDSVASTEGRTIVLVTHNMRALTTICKKAVVLEHGTIQFVGSAPEAVSIYEKSSISIPKNATAECFIDGLFRVLDVSIFNLPMKKGANAVLLDNAPLCISVLFDLFDSLPEHFTLMFHLLDADSNPVFSFSPTYFDSMSFVQGRQELKCTIPAEFLNAGTYSILLLLMKNETVPLLRTENILRFNLFPGGRLLGKNDIAQPGHVRPRFNWELNPILN